ncbi:MAG: hypothetical protein DM484_12535 [Candidatus Methylumidiphilus alinenensis]|uniref:Uncharacterized protein n=1 Tax=Candidatus Methylumidiphilus alinenensis TaxID=2202197 RepID=A0A2W4SU54_9GAMM|nr:MAG: hypothetical protein DM484_12535 [Candidatus Methylumidiphilus alinenensis]
MLFLLKVLFFISRMTIASEDLVIVQPDGCVCGVRRLVAHGSESGDESPHSTFGWLNDDQGQLNNVIN